jgi:hypothetical protein
MLFISAPTGVTKNIWENEDKIPEHSWVLWFKIEIFYGTNQNYI